MTHAGRASLAVEVARVPGGRRRLARDLRRLTAHAAGLFGGDLEIAFAVIDDERMHALNRQFLAHDHPTDVLAFPLAEEPCLMGDVLISADTARREAARRGHPAYHELLLYAVHGVLHLIGHDDHDTARRRRMRRAEREALAALEIPPVYGRAE
jgi:probable rRNA maturation factor